MYNLLGAKVTTLASGLQPAGTHTLQWDATENASGIYIIRLETALASSSQKLTIVK